MTGIGIDTGGTYTDALIYDLDTDTVLESAKARTTHEDLKIGIKEALKGLSRERLRECGLLSLSTTLATNACVENKGGAARLILIGVPEKTFAESYMSYGIDRPEDVYLLECELKSSVEKSTEPDWKGFCEKLPEILKGCACVSVVQMFAKQHGGAHEKKAAELITACVPGLPVIMGHELFPDLNAMRRGAGALLNARLVPVICDFLTAVREVFREYGLTVPAVIVRSDGALMNEQSAGKRPVETLLCGPAASVIGAAHLTREETALVVDIGGTTTDVAMIRGGIPRVVSDGIKIGAWKTFVKGLYVDTFALGGDTVIRFDAAGRLVLGKERVVPLCALVSAYPEIQKPLRRVAESGRISTFPLYECLCLVRMPGQEELSGAELALCRALSDGPFVLEDAAARVRRDLYNLDTRRLEQRGIIIRAGFTPTDAMHLLGDFDAFSADAAACGAACLSRVTGLSGRKLAERCYDLVIERLYKNLARILLCAEYPQIAAAEQDGGLSAFIDAAYEQAKSGGHAFCAPRITTNAALIGIGAPAHIFIGEAARLLGTRAVVPEYAPVANALGAVVGNIVVREQIELRPLYHEDAPTEYVVYADRAEVFEEYGDARDAAEQAGRSRAAGRAREQGACGELTLRVDIHRKESMLDTGSLFLSETVEVIAQGKAWRYGQSEILV